MGGLIHLIGGSRCVGGPGLRPSNNRTQRWRSRRKRLQKLSRIAISPQIKITASVLDGRSDGSNRASSFFFPGADFDRRGL